MLVIWFRYVGLAPPPSDPYGGSHVPPVPVPLPPPVPAPSSYVSVKVMPASVIFFLVIVGISGIALLSFV